MNLSEIAESNRRYDQEIEEQESLARQLFALEQVAESAKAEEDRSRNSTLQENKRDTGLQGTSLPAEVQKYLTDQIEKQRAQLNAHTLGVLDSWKEKKAAYTAEQFVYHVRSREF